jgi:hypothetical protein
VTHDIVSKSVAGKAALVSAGLIVLGFFFGGFATLPMFLIAVPLVQLFFLPLVQPRATVRIATCALFGAAFALGNVAEPIYWQLSRLGRLAPANTLAYFGPAQVALGLVVGAAAGAIVGLPLVLMHFRRLRGAVLVTGIYLGALVLAILFDR